MEASRGISRNCYTSIDSSGNGVLENDMLSRCGVMFDHYTSTDSNGKGVRMMQEEEEEKMMKRKKNQKKRKITMHRLILVLTGSSKLIFSQVRGDQR